ncbi:MAG: UDP-N-acetylglucosamine 2-epimerase [Planctomycetota bacterium]|nr:UDP-N-acetylglucosamine 2-epimerase [Planctomycetota bacterium]
MSDAHHAAEDRREHPHQQAHPKGNSASGEGAGTERAAVAVVTGSRADFGLLRPVMLAIAASPELELAVIAAGSHLVSRGHTYRDVKREFEIAAAVPMQVAGRTGREADAEAVGVGVGRFVRAFQHLKPRCVLVLGDRIEAFAAAAAASVGGWRLAHVHGGDRAEGVADEAMRHAITKLAHVHFAATPMSGERIVRMGEVEESVHVVGSPAIDGLRDVPVLDEKMFAELGRPGTIVLHHPVGMSDAQEELLARSVLAAAIQAGSPVLVLDPNLDPGRDGIIRAIDDVLRTPGIEALGGPAAASIVRWPHLTREKFLGLLKRLAKRDQEGRTGVIVGNSSAALIECAALGVPAVNIGPRQSGRERFANVVDVDVGVDVDARGEAVRGAIGEAIRQARSLPSGALDSPASRDAYGDGQAGERIAEILARTLKRGGPDVNVADQPPRKRNTY